MSRYYTNYTQYLGAQRCCDFRGAGPQGMTGPTGASAIGQRGHTGPTGESVTGPTGRSCRGPTGYTGPTGPPGTGEYLTTMLGGLATNISNLSVTYFGAYFGSFSTDASSNEAAAITIIPFDCTLSNMYINLDNAPGDNAKYIFRVYKNHVSTSFDVEASGESLSYYNLSDSISFSAGDTFSIECDPDNGFAPFNVRWTCKLTSKNA